MEVVKRRILAFTDWTAERKGDVLGKLIQLPPDNVTSIADLPDEILKAALQRLLQPSTSKFPCQSIVHLSHFSGAAVTYQDQRTDTRHLPTSRKQHIGSRDLELSGSSWVRRSRGFRVVRYSDFDIGDGL